jgi:hypothetical protein
MPATGDPKADKLTRKDLDDLVIDAQRSGKPDTAYAQTIFKRGVLGAAQTIVDLAVAGSSERIRYQAATYVIDRVMGRVQDNPPKNEDEPFEKLMAECVSSIPDDEYNKIQNERKAS